MRTEINEMLLRRKNKVTVKKNDIKNEITNAEKAMVATMMKNVESLGFTFDKELFETLLTYSKTEIETIYLDLISKLKVLVGADKEYIPMYPNFPQQVADADSIELFVNAIIHYWSYGTLMPEYEKDERLPLFDNVNFKILSVGNDDDIFEIFTNLVSSKTNISQQDKDDISLIIATYPDFNKYLPEELPLKENVALIGKLILDKAPIKRVSDIQKYYKTATDVLRLITALSDGDISLATKTKYKHLRRYERRMVMDLLADCGNITEDLFRYQYEWIRVAEIVHPFEFHSRKYNGVNKAFDVLRNKHKPLFDTGKIQRAIADKDIKTAVDILKYRPGEFARTLDKLLRDADTSEKIYIINTFAKVATKVSVPILLQLSKHFENRNNNKLRVIFPKGTLANVRSINNDLPGIDNKTCRKIVTICEDAIVKQFKSKPKMGNVFIDNELMNYIVPFSQRSASSANKTLVRGSRIGIRENANAVRAFIWWTNDKCSRVDIDLTAAIFDENWKFIEHVSYTNLRSHKYRACHSGDIVNGGSVNGEGVAEFIDIDIDSVNKYGRYVCFQIYSYTKQKFKDLPNCRFGWMEREDVDSGEIFEPKTVEVNMDVTSNSTIDIPVIFDCKTREFIWCDLNLGITKYLSNNVENNLSGINAACYAMSNINKPNLYKLIFLNALARGKIVTDRNEADIIFSNDRTIPVEVVAVKNNKDETEFVQQAKENVQIITAYDIVYFVGEML